MGSSSKGATTNVSNNSPPPEVMQEYENIINRANVVGSQPYQQYGGQMVAPMSQEQLSGIGGINNAQGIAQPYFNQAQDYLSLGAAPTTGYDINRFQNPYTDQVVNATLGNLNQLNQEQQTGLEGNVMGQGGLFNDRLGVAQAQLAKQQATAEAPTIAGLRSAGYSQALSAAQAEKNRELGAASSEAGLGTANLADLLQGFQAQFGAGTAEQQLAQQYLNVPYQQFQQQQAYPYQQLSWLAGIGTGVGSNMGGTSTSTTTPPKPWYQFWKDGGGIKRPGYDDGGGIGGYPYAGASSYIPGISITHGSGPPKPTAGHQQKGQDPFGDIMKMGQSPMGKGLGKMFNPSTQGGIPDLMGTGEPGLDEVTQAGAESGMSAGELGFTAGGTDLLASGAGDAAVAGGGEAAAGAGAAMGGMDLSALFALFALKDGGGINMRRGGGIDGLHRLHRAEGGDTYDDAPYVPPDDIPTSSTTPPDASAGAGLAPMAVAGVSGSPAGHGLPAGLAGLDPGGLAASPSRAPTWPGETPSEPPAMAPRTPNPVAASPVTVSSRGDALAPGSTDPGIERSKRAIGTFESGNNYNAVGPMTHLGRALGRYQVMEKELPGQLRASGLPPMTSEEFLRDHAAQDKLFETVFGGHLKKYGNFNDAASVWFSGRPVAQAGNARDILGTTVPQYLANTNAILARDDGANARYGPGGAGGDRLPAGAIPTSGRADGGLRLTSTSDGEGDGETRTQRGSGLGSLFTAENAVRFGLSMLANPTPYIGNAIGQAGLATLGANAEQGRYEAKQRQEDRKFTLDTRYKQAQIDKMTEGINLQGRKLDLANAQTAERGAHFQDLREHQQALEKQAAENAEAARRRDEARAAEGRYSMVPGTGTHPETGEQVSGVYKLDAKTGKTEFVPGVNLTTKGAATGAPLPPAAAEAHGDEFLSYLPHDEAGLVKGIAEYSIDPKTLSSKGGHREELLKKVMQYDPTFDQKRYNETYNAVNRFSTGKQGDTIRSFNVGLDHLETLGGLADALKNGDIRLVNQIGNRISTELGRPGVTNFEAARDIVSNEIVKAIVGAGGGVNDREEAQKRIMAAASPAQLKGVIETYQKLMAGQLRGLKQQYEDATGLKNFERKLTPSARKLVESLDAGAAGAGAGGGGGGGRSPIDQQALDWATANPSDSRAAAIKKRLGVP